MGAQSMAKIQCRNIDEDVYEAVVNEARRQERTLEGHIRFLLKDWYDNNSEGFRPPTDDEQYGWLPKWIVNELRKSAEKGFRSPQHEIIKRLTASFNEENIYDPAMLSQEELLKRNLVS